MHAACLLIILASSAFASPPSAPWFPKAPALPEPAGQVIKVSNVSELFNAAKAVKPGGTILLADGRYKMPRYFEIETDNVTLRGASGDRHKVILDGSSSRHGELIGISRCVGVTIAHLTIENVKFNGFKINSNLGAKQVTIYDCVIHNVWERGIKVPRAPKEELMADGCRVQYCLFYNDRAKQFSDDEADTAENFNGNYVGGIDAMNAVNWIITDNVFVGLQGRTREGRACVFLWHDSRGCVVERNVILDCDVGIALGNPHKKAETAMHATDCIVRDNLIVHCPETGILACYTKDCEVSRNSIYDPKTRQGRLIWAQQSNDGLKLTENLLVGAPLKIQSESKIVSSGNLSVKSSTEAMEAAKKAGHRVPPAPVAIEKAVAWTETRMAESAKRAQEKTSTDQRLGKKISSESLSPEVVTAMRRVHAGFKGNEGYIAQFGDSISNSMAFWSPMDWDDPSKFLTGDDGLPKTPKSKRWRDYIKGARDKGPKFANYSGWKSAKLLGAVEPVLKREKPMAAIIMIGTNDIRGGKVPEAYRANVEAIVDKCLAAHCVPILNTIPPRRDRDEAVGAVNKIIHEIAKEKHVPLVDFHAACLAARPGTTWDGTVISKDGVHPSGGKTNLYTPGNLRESGYALRNWVNFLTLRELVFKVFEAN